MVETIIGKCTTDSGISIAYDYTPTQDGETVLFIMGLGGQLINWPSAFVAQFTNAGYGVLRIDNRDVGLSTILDSAGLPDMAAIMAALQKGEVPETAYTLEDMAADTVQVLDHLGLDKVHVVGASMGGMIGQVFSATYPDRVGTFASIMSSLINPFVQPLSDKVKALAAIQPDPNDVEAVLDLAVKVTHAVGSQSFPKPAADIRAATLAAYKRSNHPDGAARQRAAIFASNDRTELAKKITAPTLVIHGDEDGIIPLVFGERTAENIDGAKLLIVHGMGHDLPPMFFEPVFDALNAFFQNPAAVPDRAEFTPEQMQSKA